MRKVLSELRERLVLESVWGYDESHYAPEKE
jgi:hypothetical protein